MPNLIRAVQFHHNGGEHLTSLFNKEQIKLILHEGRMPWNSFVQHRRKFIKNFGRFVYEENCEEKVGEGELMFWGEWEGVSEVSKINYTSRQEIGMPEYIHEPIANKLSDYLEAPVVLLSHEPHWQNTDPYVFGDSFLYSNCHQKEDKRLKYLSPGSVIVMGSKNNHVFRVDTVIVISEIICSYSRNYLTEIEEKLRTGTISKLFWETTIVPLLQLNDENGRQQSCRRSTLEENDELYTLYRAASFENKFEGMYSFFPCKLYETNDGFIRTPVTHSDYINPKLFIGVKASNEITLDKAKEFWESIRKQVLDSGQYLGVWAKEPSYNF